MANLKMLAPSVKYKKRRIYINFKLSELYAEYFTVTIFLEVAFYKP
jgi:hypothetical protein